MKKNIVILILTAVCLFEFVFVLTASRENSSSGENGISEGNAREEEAKGDSGKAAVQEDIDTDFQAQEMGFTNGIFYVERLKQTQSGEFTVLA